LDAHLAGDIARLALRG